MTATITDCAVCRQSFTRRGKKPGRFCSIGCKAAWQRTQKPVDREWLHQRYVVEGQSTYQIAKQVHRNPKQVWQWLKGYGVPIRERTWVNLPSDLPHQSEEWLREQYVTKQRSAEEIAAECGVTGNNVRFFLERFGIERRTISETRAVKYWGSPGSANPMFGKRGAEVPSWKGGVTPERQGFYSTPEWLAVSRAVWARDRGTCQRCETKPVGRAGHDFHIHHIVSFAVRELRAEARNLVLLCVKCHRWVHSRGNPDRLFLGEKGGAK